MNPLNQLPTSAERITQVDALAEQAARELDCMVILIAMKENDKTHVTMTGVPDSGLVAALAKDLPRLLEMTAFLMRLNDELLKAQAQ